MYSVPINCETLGVLLPVLALSFSPPLQQRAEKGALQFADILGSRTKTISVQSGLQVLLRVDQQKEQEDRHERPDWHQGSLL